jgi:DNA gyrase subunit A
MQDESYLDYAMSVIVGRAIPDARDGLKPVHRRILYAMHELRLTPASRTRSARAWWARCSASTTRTATRACTTPSCAWRRTSRCADPLIDGQGNFGSVDGDPARGDALHRGPAREDRRRAPRRTSRRRPSTSRPTSTRASGAHGAPGALPQPARSTARAASRWAWRRTSRRTTSARSSTRRCTSSTTPTPASTTSCVREGAPTSPRAASSTGARASAGATARAAATSSCAPLAEIEPRQGRPRADRGHGDPVPGQQGQACSSDGRARAREAIEGISTCATRAPRGHAGRGRAQARRQRPGRAQPALQEHPAPESFGVINLAIVGGQPRCSTSARCSGCSSSTAATWSRAARASSCARPRRSARSCSALGMATTEIDLVIKTIRESPDVDTAREADGAAAARLEEFVRRAGRPEDEIAEAASAPTTGSPSGRPRPSSTCASRAHGPRAREARGGVRRAVERPSRGCAASSATSGAADRDRHGARGDPREVRRPAPHRDRRPTRPRSAIEDLIQEAGHGGHLLARRLHQAHGPLGLPAQKRGGKGKIGMEARDEDFINQLFVSSHALDHVFFFSDKGEGLREEGLRDPARGRAPRRGEPS